jgi:predicted NACHT family NTPase
MPAELTHLNGRIPFFIRLRRYTHDALPTPQHFIDELAKPLEGLMPVGRAEQELIGGQAIVLIDGVDEVAEADRPVVGRWLDQIVTAFPKPTYVITSRPAAVESDFDLPAGFSGANLEPLSYPEIARFIGHWHRATAMSLVGSEATELVQRAPKLALLLFPWVR